VLPIVAFALRVSHGAAQLAGCTGSNRLGSK
jgi:hypothetical protein